MPAFDSHDVLLLDATMMVPERHDGELPWHARLDAAAGDIAGGIWSHKVVSAFALSMMLIAWAYVAWRYWGAFHG